MASASIKDGDVFRAFVKAGERLAVIHVQYEQQPEYPLTEKKSEKLKYRAITVSLETVKIVKALPALATS